MLDDNNAKEMEAALREEEELDIPDGMTPEDWREIQEEAQAEEEFIADREDTVKPLVFQKKNEDGSVKTIDTRPETHSVSASDGVLGSGDFEKDLIGEPINNEEELRKESVTNMDDDPTKTTDAAAEPVDDAPVDDSGLGGDTEAEPVATDSPEDAAPASEESVAEPETAAEPMSAEETPAVDPMREGVEEAASADIPAATDTPTPIPGGMPTSPVTTDTPAPAAKPVVPKKKKKFGLILGVLAFLLVVGGGVAAFLFYNAHEAPEQQVKDAVSNVFNAKTAGATKVSALESGKLPFIGMRAQSKSEQFGEMDLSFDFALKGTGTFYTKISGLDKVVDTLKEGFLDATEDSKALEKVINVVMEPIDNKWIAINFDDEEMKATVSCMSESINGLLSEGFRKKAGAAFDKYPFVKYKKDSKVETRDGLNYYEVEIDEEMGKKFSEELKDTDELKAFEKCSTSFTGGSSMIKTSARLSTATELDDDEYEFEYEEEDEDFDVVTLGDKVEDRIQSIKFGITNWNHELQEIEFVSGDDKTGKETVNISFKAISESDVKDAQSIEDIVKGITENIPKVLGEYACDRLKEEIGNEEFDKQYDSRQECVESIKDQYGEEFDVSNLLGGMTTTSLRTRI